MTTTKELSCSEKPFHTKATLPSGRRSSWLPAADHGATRGSGARHTWRVTVISPPPERICSVQTVWMCRAKGLIWPAPVVGFIRRLRGNKGGRRALGAWWGVPPCSAIRATMPAWSPLHVPLSRWTGRTLFQRLILPFPYAPVHLLTKCLGHQPVGAFLECGCVRWQREGRVRRGGGRFAPGSERRREEEWKGGVLLLSTDFLRDFGLELSDNTRVNSVQNLPATRVKRLATFQTRSSAMVPWAFRYRDSCQSRRSIWRLSSPCSCLRVVASWCPPFP